MEKVEKSAENPKETVIKASIRGLDESHTPFFDGITKTLFTTEANVTIETLYKVVKQSPEVLGCIEAITEDIMADEWKYLGSKDAIKRFEEFSNSSNFYKILTNAVYDMLITGNAYILKLDIPEEKMKRLLTIVTKDLAEKLSLKMKRKQIVEFLKQEGKTPKDLQVLKASTITINYDETGKVASYHQKVGGNERVYSPKDIIHLSLINIGGEVYGFSPMEPLLSDIATLLFAKNYVGKYFENNGLPDWMFIMPEDNPDSRNYKLLKENLKDMKKKDEKHRNLLVTGKIDAKEIAKFNKDMEFSKLIQHFTQLILIGMGVPTHRINYTLTDSQSGSQVNRAYEGYYKKISFVQKLIENQLNKDLFSHFGKIRIKFNRAYKIDEMREAQIIQVLSQVGAITIEEARDMIGLDTEMPKGTMPKRTGDDNSIDFNEDKKREQGQDRNPKSPDANMDNKLKSVQDAVLVDFDKFVMAVERMAGLGNFDKAKVLYKEYGDLFVLFFNDMVWTYKTIVYKSEIDVEKFRVERLSRAILIRDSFI